MAHITADRVLETSTTTGTGALTLAGALTGFRPFSGVAAVSDTLVYNVWAVDTNGVPTGDWEVGIGTYSATNTLARTTVQSSSNAGAAVNFSAGTKYVSVGLSAANAVQFDNNRALPLVGATTAPPSPAVGNIVYSREVAQGAALAHVAGPAWLGTPIQPSLHFSRLQKLVPSNTTLVGIGLAGFTTTSPAGFYAVSTPSVGSAKNAILRCGQRSAASAGSLCIGHATASGAAPMIRGTSPGEGGFLFTAGFAGNTLPSGCRASIGISDSTLAPTNVDPLTATTPGRIQIAFADNTGTLKLVHCLSGSTPTVIDLGVDFPVDTTSWYDLVIFAASADSGISYRVTRFTTSLVTPAAVAEGRIESNLPAATTVLNPWYFWTNNTTASFIEVTTSGFTLGAMR